MSVTSIEARRKTATRNEAAAAGPLSEEQLRKLLAYWRAANYLSVGQIYQMDNLLLKELLQLKLLGLELDAKANATCKPDADIARTGLRGQILVVATREDATMLEEVGRVLGIFAPEPELAESSAV